MTDGHPNDTSEDDSKRFKLEQEDDHTAEFNARRLVIRKLRAKIAKLRAALESIREQTECRSGKGGGCWFDQYGKHSPDCTWGIAEEADDALKEAKDE